MTDFEQIEIGLHEMGFDNIKRWVEYKPAYTVTALEVYSPPILMYENVTKIKQTYPYLHVTGNTNQSYILIKQK